VLFACLVFSYDSVTAVRIGDLWFFSSAVGTNWGSDKDEDEESKTILHLSSSSDDCHDSGVSDEASWLLPSSVVRFFFFTTDYPGRVRVNLLIYESCSGLKHQFD
jgi:hypothetical protein